MFIEAGTKEKGIDFQILLYYVLLVIIGWITIFSTAYNPELGNPVFSLSNAYTRQGVFMLVSTALASFILIFDHKFIVLFTNRIYLLCLLLMISVLFIGSEISGAKAWIKIGSFSIQPAEFMKIATALVLAKFFSEGKTNIEKKYLWAIAFAFVFLPIVIILLQRDTGSALVFLSFIFVFYRAGLTGWILIIGVASAFIFVFTLYFNELYAIALLTVLLIISILINKKEKKNIRRNILLYLAGLALVFIVNMAYSHVLQAHQKQRVDTLLGKVYDPRGADFNVNQSKIAIGSGGLFGKGYMEGTQTKLDFVPEQSTDFIFCGIGEEWGFMGSLAIVFLYSALIIRIITVSERHRLAMVRYYGYGIAGILFAHFAINIGMTIGLLPIIGIPLPLISYGGSSLLAFTCMIFLFQRFAAH